MTTNVTLEWDLPVTRESGNPLSQSEIGHVIIELSADGGSNFTEINTKSPAEEQKVMVPDLEVGDWVFRLTVTDISGRSGQPHLEPFVIPDEAPPGSVLNVRVTLG